MQQYVLKTNPTDKYHFSTVDIGQSHRETRVFEKHAPKLIELGLCPVADRPGTMARQHPKVSFRRGRRFGRPGSDGSWKGERRLRAGRGGMTSNGYTANSAICVNRHRSMTTETGLEGVVDLHSQLRCQVNNNHHSGDELPHSQGVNSTKWYVLYHST